MKKITIGTRGSELALAQTKEVVDRLNAIYPDLELIVKPIKTKGDKLRKIPIHKIGIDAFTKEIEESLSKKEIDLAVHSAKDLPLTLPRGLVIACVLKRVDPRDCLITRDKIKLKKLPIGARIGTSSPRRKAQLLNYRNDLSVVEIRGNINTRIDNLLKGNKDLDGIILAACGIKRLRIKGIILETLPYDIMLPAAGQGALCIETRRDNIYMLNILKSLNDKYSSAAVMAERSFQKGMGEGCSVPVGCLAKIKGNKLILTARILLENGEKKADGEITGKIECAEALGCKLADRIYEKWKGFSYGRGTR